MKRSDTWEDVRNSRGEYNIRHWANRWILYRGDAVVSTHDTRDDVVDAWARRAKLPVCSICRCVHGQEIVHECE